MSTLKLAIQQRDRLARTLETRAQREMEMLATALSDLAKTLLAEVNESFPSNWLDTLLTGPDAVIPKEPPFAYGCPDVERLVQAIQKRVNGAVKLRCAELGIEIGE